MLRIPWLAVHLYIKFQRSPALNSIELKIPPPAVAFLVCTAMWGLSLFTPVVDVSMFDRAMAALVLALIGGLFGAVAVVSFGRAKTTIHPTKPQATSSLVTTGIYRYTRNPMYVGVLLLIVAWAAFLCSPWALLGPVAFVLYITRFQIQPEERVLSGLFGAEYAAYRSRVRRWL
ncbi:MAG: isoprenylcysteine carboxylmethyltransferase family protein [Betaproteobacteria bacterium]